MTSSEDAIDNAWKYNTNPGVTVEFMNLQGSSAGLCRPRRQKHGLIVTVTLASGAWIKLRAVDIDHDRTAAHTDRVIIKATTSTQMTTSAGRKYMNFTFGPTFVATAWFEDVDWDETRLLGERHSFQFDTKGVDFGSWLRSFRAQVYRNWLIPSDALNKGAFTALKASSPTVPLPNEYPEEKMVMTVIFYYNESPPAGGAANGLGGLGTVTLDSLSPDRKQLVVTHVSSRRISLAVPARRLTLSGRS